MNTKHDFYKIGNRIAQERKKLIHPDTKKSYTQSQFIELLNNDYGISIKRTSWSHLEYGHKTGNLITLELLDALCQIFHCEVGYLLCEEGYEQKTRKATDLCNATGLTRDALNGIYTIQHPKIHRQVNSYDVNLYTCLYFPDKGEIDNQDALNWLLSTASFRGLVAFLLFRLQIMDRFDFHEYDMSQYMTMIMNEFKRDAKSNKASYLVPVYPSFKEYNREVEIQESLQDYSEIVARDQEDYEYLLSRGCNVITKEEHEERVREWEMLDYEWEMSDPDWETIDGGSD